jgi:hypothetical protein
MSECQRVGQDRYLHVIQYPGDRKALPGGGFAVIVLRGNGI